MKGAHLLHAVQALLQELDLGLRTVWVLLVGPAASVLLPPQEVHLVPVGVQLPAQGVVLLLQRRRSLIEASCRRTGELVAMATQHRNQTPDSVERRSLLPFSPVRILLQGLWSESSSDISISSSRLMPMISSLWAFLSSWNRRSVQDGGRS